MNILFRVTGGQAYNKEYGLGHVYRAINLASQLKQNKIYFFVEDYGRAVSFLKKYGYGNTFTLEKGINVKSDIKKTIQFVNEKKIDILIVDKWDLLTKEYVKSMRKFVKIVVIPDLNKIDYDADLIINGFIGFKKQDY